MATSKQTNAMLSTRETWIAKNATLRLPRLGNSVIVRAERGTVLVTQEGDLEDHVLAAGDEVVLAGGRLAVAWAFTEAAISVRESTLAASSRERSGRADAGRSRGLTYATVGVM